MPGRALDGVVVLDLGHIYLAPYCGLLLAHLGAEVIKVEPPAGDGLRRRGSGSHSVAFHLLNAGKRSVRLDLKSAEGRELFLELVKTADIVCENYRRGVLERLGLGYAVLASVNPRVILARGRGFAPGGPHEDMPAMDVTVQAMTGVMSVNGFPDQPPVKAGIAAADFLAGTHLAGAVLAALFQRNRTGEGQEVEVAMQDALLPALASNLAGFIGSNGALPERTGNRHSGLGVCPYNVYAASEGWLAICCESDRHWFALCEAMGRDDLGSDPLLALNAGRVADMERVDAEIGLWIRPRRRDECVHILRQAGIPSAPVLSLAEVVTDPQIEFSGMLPVYDHPLHGPTRMFGNPMRLSDSARGLLEPSPELGEHTRLVLQEKLGISDTRLDELAALSVI